MAAISFVLGGDTFTFSRRINYPVSKPARSGQVINQTAAGTLEVETVGISSIKTLILNFTCLTSTDYTGLINWRDNISNWAANSFTYNDENGVANTVRWIDQSFDIPLNSYEKYSATITLEIV